MSPDPLAKGALQPLVNTVAYCTQTGCLLQILLKPLGISKLLDSFDTLNLQDGYLPENDFHENADDDPHTTDEHLEASVEYNMGGGFIIVKRRKPRILRSIRIHKDKDPKNYYCEQFRLYYPSSLH